MSEEQSLKQKTAKGLFWGGLNSSIQQLLGLLFGIVLGRLLDRSDYGMIGMLAIFPAIASALQESGLVAALANREKVSDKDYNAVFWFSISCGATLYVLLYLSAPLIADFYDTPELTSLARFLSSAFYSQFRNCSASYPLPQPESERKYHHFPFKPVRLRNGRHHSCRERIRLLGHSDTNDGFCPHRHYAQLVLCPLETQFPHRLLAYQRDVRIQQQNADYPNFYHH